MLEANDGQYLLEIRQRLLRCAFVWIISFAILIFFSDKLFYSLAYPLLTQFPNSHALIATTVIAPLWIPIKFTFAVSLLLCIPYMFYQLWAFVLPALYKHERKLIWILLLASTLLFYIGMLFVYTIVLPLLFSFFKHFTPSYVLFMPDISHYLSFVSKMFFAFGFAFQFPVVLLVLLKIGVIDLATLNQSRPYVIVIAFVVGMLLTPPDVLSQILLAVPLCLLFEATIILARWLKWRQ